jgi:hypothetical protein
MPSGAVGRLGELRAHHLRLRARGLGGVADVARLGLDFLRPRETSACPLRPSRMKRSSVAIRLTSDQRPCDGQDVLGSAPSESATTWPATTPPTRASVGEFLHALLVGLLDQARSTSFSTRSPGASTRHGSMPTRSARLASWKPG